MKEYDPILPSTLLEEQGDDETGYFNHKFNNFALRSGVIVKSHDIGDIDNQYEMGPEYDVVVIEQDANRGNTSTIYKNCLSMDSFGSMSDFIEYKRRSAEKPEEFKRKLNSEEQNGPVVLLLCIDGNSEKAVIIGGLSHSNKNRGLTKDAGNALTGEFNGLRWCVDKDGAFLVTQKTPTDNQGKPKSTAAAGSKLSIEKDGSIELSDGKLDATLGKGNQRVKQGSLDSGQDATEQQAAEGEEQSGLPNEKVRLDRTAQTVSIEARKNIGITTDKDLNTTSKENTNIKATKDMLLDAQGNAVMKFMGTWDNESEGNHTFKAPNSNQEIKNLLFIKSRQTFVDCPQIFLGRAGIPALLSTSMLTLGFGNLGMPVLSVAISGYSGNVFLT